MTPALLHAQARAWWQAGVVAIDVQVLRHRGSVPRETGTHMVVSLAAVLGTIGGGHLEWQALAQARAWLQEPPALRGADAVRDVDVPLGPALGQCCGGHVVLRLQPLSEHSLGQWPSAQPRFFLQLYGAGHVGRAIVRLLEDIDCQVQWIDEREDEFPAPSAVPHIHPLCVDTPEAEVALAPPQSAYLVMTHRHDLDERITEAILRRGDARYCGLIGSATKRARFLKRMADRGVSPAALAQLTCPIGLPSIVGKEPAVLAISVVAQLLALPEVASQST